MSDKEVLKKFYYGSYKSNSKGFFSCPLYDEKRNENEQECDFYIPNQGHDLTDDEFEHFWYHVQLHHPNTYEDILNTCRLKLPYISENKKGNQMYHSIGLIFGNLNQLVGSFSSNELNAAQFMEQFKSELSSLEKKVSEIVKPVVSPNPAPTSWPHL